MEGKLVFLCLVAAVAAVGDRRGGAGGGGGRGGNAGGGGAGSGGSGGGYAPARTFEDLVALIDALEGDLNSDIVQFSDVATLLAAGDDQTELIEQRLVPRIQLINNQQDDLLNNAEGQLEDLADRVTDAASAISQAVSQAEASRDVLAEVRQDVTDIQNVDTQQTQDISDLRAIIAEWQQSFLDRIDSNVVYLNNLEDAVSDQVDAVEAFVDDRRCEVGTVVIPPGEFSIAFKTPFDEPPQVSVYTIGFRGQLDRRSYGEYDTLALDKSVTAVTAQGFTVSAQDLSEGMVEVEWVYCNYIACQNVEDGPVLPPINVAPPPAPKTLF